MEPAHAIFLVAGDESQEKNTRGSRGYTYRTVAGSAASSERLGCHGSIAAMMFSMDLGRLCGMMARVMKMTLSHVSMMSSPLVISLFVMPGRFLVVVRGFLVVICRPAVMFGRFLRHVGFLLEEK